MTLSMTAGVGSSPLRERGDDLYETPPEAVRALLKVERLSGTIWECACGPGSIVKVLRKYGHRVYATDLVDYGCPDSESRIDFLMEGHPGFHVNAIVTNPPFKLAGQFVSHALTLGIPKVVMLLRLAFLESEGRKPVLDCGLLARVHIFRNRLPMMHRGERGTHVAKTNSSAIAFAWFVWHLDHQGPTEMRRVSWEAGQ